MTPTLNWISTALIAGLTAAGAAIAATNPQVAAVLAGAAGILKIVDGFLTHQAVKP